MSIHEHQCVTIRCEVCGESPENDGAVEHFDNAKEAREAAEQVDWYIAEGVDICDGCTGEPHAFIPGRIAHIEHLGVIHDEPRCDRCDTPESYHQVQVGAS